MYTPLDIDPIHPLPCRGRLSLEPEPLHPQFRISTSLFPRFPSDLPKPTKTSLVAVPHKVIPHSKIKHQKTEHHRRNPKLEKKPKGQLLHPGGETLHERVPGEESRHQSRRSHHPSTAWRQRRSIEIGRIHSDYRQRPLLSLPIPLHLASPRPMTGQSTNSRLQHLPLSSRLDQERSRRISREEVRIE